MKTSAWLLLASLAANAALVVMLLHGGGARPPGGLEAQETKPLARARPETAPPVPLGREFLQLTPEQLRDRLRALDLPASVVARLVKARIDAKVEARTRELVAEAMKSAPSWRYAKLTTDRLSFLSAAQRKEVRDLEAEARDTTVRLLGPAYADPSGRIAFKYGFVSPEKALLLDALDEDYENLRAAQKDDARYLRLPGDRDSDKLLRAEQDRDLAALLTPAERDQYDLRASSTAQNSGFRAQIAAFQPSEEEYRALLQLQRMADNATEQGDGVRPTSIAGATMLTINGGRREPPEDAVRTRLGEERFAEWQLAGQPYYQGLTRLAADQNLPAGTARQLGEAITKALDESWRVAGDTALSTDQKRAAVAALAAGVQAQLVAGLGAGPAAGFLRSQRWFESLNNGTAVQVRGNTIGFRSVDSASRMGPVPGPRPNP